MTKTDAIKSKDQIWLSGDDAKQTIGEDEFGLKNMVVALAETLNGRVTKDGYILGIEGRWGSGKSSFVNFVVEEIRNKTKNNHIIRFEPWLVGEKNALLSYFFGQFASAIDDLKATGLPFWRIDFWRRKRLARRLAKKVRRYGEYAGVLATPMGALSTIDPSGTAALLALGLKTGNIVSKLFNVDTASLGKLRAEIISELTKLHKQNPALRFTVIIDNVDRLEPQETIEILRLVRAVADFPLTTHLLCFDRDVLCQQVTVGLQVEKAHDFVEKIFQNIITVPPQEPFALRRYLKNILQKSFPNEMGRDVPRDVDFGYRKQLLFDNWAGKFITTPRDAVRILEAAKLGWPHIAQDCDFWDFVWLQLIKLKFQALYLWVQEYLSNVGAYRDNGRAGNRESRDEAEKLYKIMSDMVWGEKNYESGLGHFLPGVNAVFLSADKRRVFDFRQDELAKFERGHRLGSPSHWRQYFSFDLPSYVIKDEEIFQFRRMLVDAPESAAAIFMSLVQKPHDRVGHYVDVLLDRLIDEVGGPLSLKERRSLVMLFADKMDEVEARIGSLKISGQTQVWRKTAKFMNKDVASDFMNLVRKGNSINWLAEILRDQGFAHGLPKGSAIRLENQWLDRAQLNQAINSLVRRFNGTPPEEIFRKPSPLDILYCWSQLKSETDVRKFIARSIKADGMFLDSLKAMCGWSSSSSDGIRHPLYRRVVSTFMDADTAKTRLDNLASSKTSNASLRERAKALLTEWSDEDFGR